MEDNRSVETPAGEMDKLEAYLKKAGIRYRRVTEAQGWRNWDQIIVSDEAGNDLWDAVCHFGSYGYEEGLLKVMGKTVVLPTDPEGEDGVTGWLTADDVIRRIEHGQADE